MRIFIVGLPQSGKTTVAKALCQSEDYRYVDAFSWVKSSFRDPKPDEHPQQYNDELHQWINRRMKLNPQFISDNVLESIRAYGDNDSRFIIDGLVSPQDFANLFDYNRDVVVFLNRTNNVAEAKDYENIGISVMRDYCFWLASAELLDRSKWLEYNFSIPGEESDWIKVLGHKNSVFLVKSPTRIISHLQEYLRQHAISG